jgi:integrase
MQDKSPTELDRHHRKGRPVAMVKQGSAAVPIYRGMVRGRTRFTVAFYLDGKRQRRSFGSLDDARSEARTAALNIQRGMSQDNDMRPQDREAFRTVQAMLAALGVPLVTAVDEYVQCRRKLGGAPLLTCVEEHVRRTRGYTTGVEVALVIGKFVVAKQQDRVSACYLALIQRILRSFGESCSGPIDAVTTAQVDGWLRRDDHCVTTRNKRLKIVKEFFGFARRQGFLPRSEPTAPEALKPGKQGDTDVGILTPGQMERLLRAASPGLMAPLAIGGFAGLRVAEIMRLDWSAVDLNRRIIELRAAQAKTASRRIVPITDNLAAWLAPVKQPSGPIVDRWAVLKLQRLARKLGIPWPHNALRHSFISYRIAVVQSAAQVALEAGNSPAIIFKHYRELVTKDEADKWFGIMPPE